MVGGGGEKQTQSLGFMTGSFPSFPTAQKQRNKKDCHCAKALKEYKQTKFKDLLFLRGSERWDKWK